MKLLDLFSGAGGAAMGYHYAGFDDITGIDITPQPHYPFRFVQADALEYLAKYGHEYDFIHASPPCQAYSVLKHLAKARDRGIVPYVRAFLQNYPLPFVIENVIGSPLHFPLKLCGSMFGLATPCGAQLRRHRLFECSFLIFAPSNCQHGHRPVAVNGHEFRNEKTRWEERKTISIHGDKARDRRTITVIGSTPQQNIKRNRIRETFSLRDAQIAMGIDWMSMSELSQAIPPAYTRWIGEQWLKQKERR